MCFTSHNKSQSKSCVQDNGANLPDYLPEEDEIPVSKTVSYDDNIMVVVYDGSGD